jgi:hypothetical protein
MASFLLVLGGRIISLFAMLIRHPILIYKTAKMKIKSPKKTVVEELHDYQIPKYSSDMKYCKSSKKYLRPVKYCESDAPEVIAMANKLGAFNVDNRKYAENVFHFVKNNIKSKNVPVYGAVKTLKKKYGSCFDSASIFIALCRCGGVEARYKIYLHKEAPEGFQTLSDTLDEDLLGGLSIIAAFYTVAEVKIDDVWLECEVTSPPELDAFWNVPIAHFGENCGKVGGWLPDDVIYLEKLPYRITIPTNFMFKLLSKLMKEINLVTEEEWQQGRKKLEKMGRKEYDKKARRKYGFLPSLED